MLIVPYLVSAWCGTSAPIGCLFSSDAGSTEAGHAGMQQAAAAAVHGGTAAVHGCPVVKPKLSLDGVAMTGTFEFCDTGHAFLLSWLWNATQSMCFGTVCTAISDGTAVPFWTDEMFVLVAPTMCLSSLAHNMVIWA